MKKILLLILLTAGLHSCVPVFNMPAAFNPSPRDAYERKLKRNFPELIGWLDAHNNALATPRNITVPHGGKGIFKSDAFPVYCYRFDMQAGEVLDVKILTELADQNIFIDLYAAENITKPVESNEKSVNSLESAIAQSGTYVLSIQPEAAAAYRCTILINKRPVYGFPVAGKGNAAIQSFWDAPRDGGQRRHEGIDIFAKRGTPVVAVTNGMITDTADRGLGGKQVWQRSGLMGNSIYYAHLDQIAVASGTIVKRGDTLGFIGNTGNAKGGPTHLHFGIYKGWNGAVNPLPYVYQQKQIGLEDVSKSRFRGKSTRSIRG